jgi:enoyl-CoA hydratase/carnithine racemase
MTQRSGGRCRCGVGGIVRLVNTVGVGIAMELELMGEPIDAHRAKEVHLVNRVVPHGDLMATGPFGRRT